MQHENTVEMEHMHVRTVLHENQKHQHQQHIIRIQMKIYVFVVVLDRLVVMHDHRHVQIV